MNPKTPKALAQFSVILVVVGIVVGDPLAGFFFFTLAGVVAALSLAFGPTKVRLIALLLLAMIIALAVWKYPDARKHLDRYRERAHADRQGITAPTGTQQGMEIGIIEPAEVPIQEALCRS
jgi:membrane protein implicated in regulation of membrane protease activity